jgi:hypothetical protein
LAKRVFKWTILSFFPYVSGAKRHKEEIYNPASNSISNLISDISNSNDEYIGVIQYCDTIDNVVIGIIHRDSIGDAYDTAIKAKNKQGRLSLLCTLDEEKYGSSIDKITNSLVGAFSNPINSKRYSWDDFIPDWISIPPNELKIIEQVNL